LYLLLKKCAVIDNIVENNIKKPKNAKNAHFQTRSIFLKTLLFRQLYFFKKFDRPNAQMY